MGFPFQIVMFYELKHNFNNTEAKVSLSNYNKTACIRHPCKKIMTFHHYSITARSEPSNEVSIINHSTTTKAR
jgi:hypothetical protein